MDNDWQWFSGVQQLSTRNPQNETRTNNSRRTTLEDPKRRGCLDIKNRTELNYHWSPRSLHVTFNRGKKTEDTAWSNNDVLCRACYEIKTWMIACMAVFVGLYLRVNDEGWTMKGFLMITHCVRDFVSFSRNKTTILLFTSCVYVVTTMAISGSSCDQYSCVICMKTACYQRDL